MKVWSEIVIELFLIRFAKQTENKEFQYLKMFGQNFEEDKTYGKVFYVEVVESVSKLGKGQKISTVGIKNLFSSDPEKCPNSVNIRALNTIFHYLVWLEQNKKISNEASILCHAKLIAELKPLVAELNPLVEKALPINLPSLPSIKSDVNQPDKGFHQSNLVRDIFANAAQSDEEREAFCENIFKGETVDDEYKDQAYFVVYRQSTKPGLILKSFLAILTPAENTLGFFSYIHIVKGDHSVNDITKITRGLITHLQPATYLIGGTKRNGSRNAVNFEFITIEREELQVNTPGIYALCMSSAARNQPIVARMVLVQIGSRRSIGETISDEHVKPREFPFNSLESVMREDIGNIKNGFQYMRSSEGEFRNVERRIRNGIQNIPRFEQFRRVQKKRRDHVKEVEATCDGAIETWGDSPRD